MARNTHRRREPETGRTRPAARRRLPATAAAAPPLSRPRSRARIAGLALALLMVLGPVARAEAPSFEAELRIETRTRLVADSLSGLLSVPLGSVPLGSVPLGSVPLGVPAARTLPAVAVVTETIGPDGRASLYATRLLSLGIAVLELDFGGAAFADAPREAASPVPVERRLALALAMLREAPEVDPGRVAVIGLGEGGRALLLARSAAAPPVAIALLYPGCDAGLANAADDGEPTVRAPMLLLHGADDPANGTDACAALAAGLGGAGAGVTHQVLRGATYAWDYLTAPGPGAGRTWLPDPAGAPQRVLVDPDPVLAQIGLDRVLGFLLPRLQPGGTR